MEMRKIEKKLDFAVEAQKKLFNNYFCHNDCRQYATAKNTLSDIALALEYDRHSVCYIIATWYNQSTMPWW